MTENEDPPGDTAPRLLSMRAIAADLRVSQQWLKYWLVANPVDTEGVPFYVPIGRRWKFERQDIDRILAHMRVLESARIGHSGKSKARLAGLLSKMDGGVTYESRLIERESAKRKKEEERAKRQPVRRVRLPRAPKAKPPDAQ